MDRGLRVRVKVFGDCGLRIAGQVGLFFFSIKNPVCLLAGEWGFGFGNGKI